MGNGFMFFIEQRKVKLRYNRLVTSWKISDEKQNKMKRSSHLARRMTALNRTRRRRIFMRAVKARRLARQEVFFMQEDPKN